MQRIIEKYAVDEGLVDDATIDEYKLRWKLVDRAAEKAREICDKEGFTEDITYKTVQSCMAEKPWAANYELYVQAPAYKHTNPRKGGINKEIGYRIARAVDAVAIKGPDGKPKKKESRRRNHPELHPADAHAVGE